MGFVTPNLITIDELHTSRTYSDENGQISASRSFVAYTTESDGAVGLSGLLRNPSVPKAGDKHPEIASLTVVGVSLSPMDESRGAYTIDVSYSGSGGEGGSYVGVGFMDDNVSMSVQYIDVWRVDTGAPEEPYAGGDIGGGCADSGGNPVSFPLPLLELKYTEHITHAPNFAAYSQFVAKRNLGLFAGAAYGTVVYMGASSKRLTPDVWSVTHSFMCDSMFKHARQRAKTDIDGQIVQNDLPDGSGDGEGTCAEMVMWVQPFPDRVNLYSLFEFNPYP
tara:strand:+ start:2244 stop:3077 length:834 start_codon:yes stop_codon:yes gene_type:complete